MAYNLVPCDRMQGCLMAPSVREWLPGGPGLVHLRGGGASPYGIGEGEHHRPGQSRHEIQTRIRPGVQSAGCGQ